MKSQSAWSHAPLVKLDSSFHKAIAVSSTFGLAYVAARIGGVLVLRPQMIWPLWPGSAFLVAVLLLTPRKVWPVLLLAGLAGFAFYDAQEKLPIRATGLLLLADSIEILVAALGVSYVSGGVPRLNNVKSLAKYSLFAVTLAPLSVASVAATAFEGDSFWVGFFTEALALLTLTPAILGWVQMAHTPTKKGGRYYLEAALVFAGVAACGYLAFVAPGSGEWAALLYVLLPFLLWASLRFGVTGASTSIILVAFLAVFGLIRGRGPFTGSTPLHDVLSLQVFLLFAASSFMVLAALVEQQKAAEQTVRESEERFRLLADSTPSLMWMSGTDKLCTYFNKPWLEFTGRSFEQEYGNGWTEGVHSEDLQECLETYTQSFERRQKFAMEYRLRRHDGQYRWIYDIGVPRFNQDGSFAGYIGIVVDITGRKQAEEALAGISRRLMEAQEQERTRIARELHDDINQRLALLSVELEAHRMNPPQSAEDVSLLLAETQERINELSYDVQSISHQLHSSKLEYLGIVAATKSFCREISASQNVEIDFSHENITSHIPYEVSVCLFRVLQEALHNAVKHSKVRHCKVTLDSSKNELNLRVSDRGVGFDPETASKKEGLGLISMRERVRLVHGTITIESKPMGGTVIHVCVPLGSKEDSGPLTAFSA